MELKDAVTKSIWGRLDEPFIKEYNIFSTRFMNCKSKQRRRKEEVVGRKLLERQVSFLLTILIENNIAVKHRKC